MRMQPALCRISCRKDRGQCRPKGVYLGVAGQKVAIVRVDCGTITIGLDEGDGLVKVARNVACCKPNSNFGVCKPLRGGLPVKLLHDLALAGLELGVRTHTVLRTVRATGKI